MSEYRLAKATVEGARDVLIVRDEDGWTAPGVGWFSDDNPEAITDIRLLVVLDPEDHDAASRLLQAYGDQYASWTPALEGVNVDRLQAALRQLTKPPRIAEPGEWGVVSTEVGDLTDYWTHGYGGWFNERGETVEWDALHDPTLVREGVQS